MNRMEQSTERLGADLKRIIRDSEDLLLATSEAVGEKADEVRSRLMDTLKAARRNCRDLEERAWHGAKSADTVVRNHPYEAIAVAVGVGVIVGALLARK